METTSVAPLTSEQLLVRDASAGIPIHIEGAVDNLVLESLSANQKGVDKRLQAAIETLVVRTVHKVVNLPEFISRFLDA